MGREHGNIVYERRSMSSLEDDLATAMEAGDEAAMRTVVDKINATVVESAAESITEYQAVVSSPVSAIDLGGMGEGGDDASPLIGEAQAALYELLLAGKITPNIMNRLTFDQYMDGIKMIEERKIVGKSVLVM